MSQSYEEDNLQSNFQNAQEPLPLSSLENYEIGQEFMINNIEHYCGSSIQNKTSSPSSTNTILEISDVSQEISDTLKVMSIHMTSMDNKLDNVKLHMTSIDKKLDNVELLLQLTMNK